MMSGLCQNPINTLRAMKEIYYPSLKATVNLCGRLPEFSKETREQSQESLNATPRPCTPATICPTKRMIGPVTGRAKAELISASRMTVSAGMSVNILSTDCPPELIAGRLELLYPELSISHEAIYQWVYADARHLIPLLVRAHRNRKRRGYYRRHKKTHIPEGFSTRNRPAQIWHRRKIGHWEADTAVSRQSLAALQVSVERKPRLTKLGKLSRKRTRPISLPLT